MNDLQVQIKFEMACRRYKQRFKDLPTIMALSDLAPAIPVLQQAVRDGKPLTDQQFFQAVGIDPPDPEADI